MRLPISSQIIVLYCHDEGTIRMQSLLDRLLNGEVCSRTKKKGKGGGYWFQGRGSPACLSRGFKI